VLAAIVSLVGRHEADAAVAMLGVVPGDKARDPGSCLLDAIEGLVRVLGPVLQRPEERLDVRVVVAHARAAEGRHDAEVLQGRQHRRAAHWPAVVRVQHQAAREPVELHRRHLFDLPVVVRDLQCSESAVEGAW